VTSVYPVPIRAAQPGHRLRHPAKAAACGHQMVCRPVDVGGIGLVAPAGTEVSDRLQGHLGGEDRIAGGKFAGGADQGGGIGFWVGRAGP
jgi:hypothetical protein